MKKERTEKRSPPEIHDSPSLQNALHDKYKAMQSISRVQRIHFTPVDQPSFLWKTNVPKTKRGKARNVSYWKTAWRRLKRRQWNVKLTQPFLYKKNTHSSIIQQLYIAMYNQSSFAFVDSTPQRLPQPSDQFQFLRRKNEISQHRFARLPFPPFTRASVLD